MQFPYIEPPQRPNPATGMMQGMDVYSKILQAMAMPEMMKTQQDMAKAKLIEQQLVNQYYPQATEADIGYKGAQTDYTKEQNKWLPFTNAMEAWRAKNQADTIQQSRNRFGAAYLFSKEFASLPPSAKKMYFAQHPEAYEELMAAQGNQAMQEAIINSENSGGGRSDKSTDAFEKIITQLLAKNLGADIPASNKNSQNISDIQQSTVSPLKSTDQKSIFPLQINPNQYSALQVAGIGQIPKENVSDQNSPYSGETSFNPTNKQIQDAGYVAKFDANKAQNTAQLNSRIDAGEAITTLFEQPNVLKNLALLTKYSGAEGRAKLLWARINNPKDYLAYQNASDQLGTIISGSLKGIESIPTSNEGMRIGKNFINTAAHLATLRSDPSSVAQNLTSGIDLLTDEQNALLKTGQRAFPNLIPPHKHLRTMLDDISAGQSPEEVLKNSYKTKEKKEENPIESKKNKIKTDDSGKKMINFNGHWYSEDELK